ncbi:hypothetical protein FC961_05645 [Clostridium botulinum]|nr:hypothetical protein [Clostridium botulinum]NFO91337.1 hypothetical protein [Clostridium botulinum]
MRELKYKLTMKDIKNAIYYVNLKSDKFQRNYKMKKLIINVLLWGAIIFAILAFIINYKSILPSEKDSCITVILLCTLLGVATLISNDEIYARELKKRITNECNKICKNKGDMLCCTMHIKFNNDKVAIEENQGTYTYKLQNLRTIMKINDYYILNFKDDDFSFSAINIVILYNVIIIPIRELRNEDDKLYFENMIRNYEKY